MRETCGIKWVLLIVLLLTGNLINAEENMTLNESLSAKQQSIITISSLTAKGDLDRLDIALNKGLDNGLTVNEIKEVIVHLYAYCGFPRSIRGLQTFISALENRKAKGINDEWGKEASPITDTRDKFTRGKEILDKLVQTKQEGPKPAYAQFSPEIEVFLKEHLFADIFERDVLTYQQRELVTVSVLSSIGGVEPMLRSHLNICLNVGLTPDQLTQFIGVIESTIGQKEAKAAQSVLNEVLRKTNSQ